MLEVFLSGGWLMYPILLCSILALTIVVERLWVLRSVKLAPEDALPTILHHLQNNQVTKSYLKKVAKHSPLESVLAKGIQHAGQSYDVMMSHMAEQGRYVIHGLEKYLSALGTIAAITPLLGLLGTVTGMIQVFTAITIHGTTQMEGLAGGISQALVTTAFGLSVAIPSLMFHRYFNRKIDEIAVNIEQEALKLSEYLKDLNPAEGQSTQEYIAA